MDGKWTQRNMSKICIGDNNGGKCTCTKMLSLTNQKFKLEIYNVFSSKLMKVT